MTNKKQNFFLLLFSFRPYSKCIKKLSNFHLHNKKYWVLVFGICIWYLAYPTDRSYDDVDTVLEIELNMYIIEEFAFSL